MGVELRSTFITFPSLSSDNLRKRTNKKLAQRRVKWEPEEPWPRYALAGQTGRSALTILGGS